MAERMSRLRNEAVYAAERGDYSEAIKKLDVARIIYDTTPDVEKDGLRMEWRRIEPLIERFELLRSRQLGHGKVRSYPINHVERACR